MFINRFLCSVKMAKLLEKIIPCWIAHVLQTSPSCISYSHRLEPTSIDVYKIGLENFVMIDGSSIFRQGEIFSNTGKNSREFRAYAKGFSNRHNLNGKVPAEVPEDLESFYQAGARAGEDERIKKERERRR